ncbi:unnamed protein product [Bathycoccus prasinos]
MCSISFCTGKFLGVKKNLIDSAYIKISNATGNSRKTDIGLRSIQDEVYSMSSQAYACDSSSAYSALTRLRKRNIELQKKKGAQANRDRTATVERKAHQASAAETAFRTCVKEMMPQLLEKWDSDLAQNRIRFKHEGWDDRVEKKIGGISMEVLRQTAEELE